MKKNLLLGIGSVIVVILLFACVCNWFLSGSGSAYYYTQIDNSKITQADSHGGVVDLSGGMEYSYTLPTFNEEGDEKDITFGTSRELREGAFIRLTVMPVRGVLEWSELQYEELPVAVQDKYHNH